MRQSSLHLAFGLLTFTSLGMWSTQAQAQDTTVSVVKFGTFKASKAVMTTLYEVLDEAIEGKKGLKVVKGGKVTIDEMALMAGCSTPDEKCLSSMSGFVNADQVIFGSVQYSDNVHLFTIKVFDFKKKQFVGIVEDQAVSGDMEKVKLVLPALVESALYGDVGVLDIKLQGATKATIFLDGEAKATNSTVLEALPLGEHTVKVVTPDGQEKSKQVVIRQGSPTKVIFKLQGGPAEVVRKQSGDSPLILPGWIGVGVGAVSLATGFYFNQQWNQDNDTLESYGDSVRPDQAEDARMRIERMPGYATNAQIATGIGVASVVIGAGLLVYGYSSGGTEAQATSPYGVKSLSVGALPSPTFDGGAFSLQGTF